MVDCGVPAGRHQSEPTDVFKARNGFGDRRHIGQRRRALLAGNRQRAKLAAVDKADCRRQIGRRQVDLACDQVSNGRPFTLVRNLLNVQSPSAYRKFSAARCVWLPMPAWP